MLLITMVFCAVINTTIEIVAYRLLQLPPRLAPLITAIGMSFILQNIGLVWKGARPTSVPDILPDGEVFADQRHLHVTSTVVLFTIPSCSFIWLVQQTKQGKAMRATACDREAAAMMGINVNRTISFTFVIAGDSRGQPGPLCALLHERPLRRGLPGWPDRVYGGGAGRDRKPAGRCARRRIGMIESFNNGLGWFTPGSDWSQSIIFSILILILVFRPEGLLGERTPEGA